MVLEDRLDSEEERMKLIKHYGNEYKLDFNKSLTILFTYIRMLNEIKLWEYPHYKRRLSRVPYNNILESGYIRTDFISVEAQNIKLDPTKNDSSLLTWDHIYSPQSYSYYMYSNWHEIYNNNLHNFFKDMKMLMQVVRVRKKENNNLSKYTLNNEFTHHQLKLKVPTTHRYTAAGISILGKNTSPRTIRSEDIPNRYPWELSEHYIEWEAEHLIIS